MTKPTEIHNFRELTEICENPDDDYILMDDIHLKINTLGLIKRLFNLGHKNELPISNIYGTLDGNGYSIIWPDSKITSPPIQRYSRNS